MEKLGREVNTAELGGKKGGSHDLDEREAELGGKKGGSHDLDEREAELGGKRADPMTLMRKGWLSSTWA
jgi:hypothetical protein